MLSLSLSIYVRVYKYVCVYAYTYTYNMYICMKYDAEKQSTIYCITVCHITSYYVPNLFFSTLHCITLHHAFYIIRNCGVSCHIMSVYSKSSYLILSHLIKPVLYYTRLCNMI